MMKILCCTLVITLFLLSGCTPLQPVEEVLEQPGEQEEELVKPETPQMLTLNAYNEGEPQNITAKVGEEVVFSNALDSRGSFVLQLQGINTGPGFKEIENLRKEFIEFGETFTYTIPEGYDYIVVLWVKAHVTQKIFIENKLQPPEKENLKEALDRRRKGFLDEAKQLKEECEAVSGTWKVLPNSCADLCDYARGYRLACLESEEFGCDCGPDECWNGQQCEPN